MSASRSDGFRPQLEILEDRSLPSRASLLAHHTPAPAPAHVGINHQPPFIYNPFQQAAGFTIRGISTIAHVSHPSDGGFFPQGLGNNFYPPSMFHF